jgi:hypothetical protein
MSLGKLVNFAIAFKNKFVFLLKLICILLNHLVFRELVFNEIS